MCKETRQGTRSLISISLTKQAVYTPDEGWGRKDEREVGEVQKKEGSVCVGPVEWEEVVGTKEFIRPGKQAPVLSVPPRLIRVIDSQTEQQQQKTNMMASFVSLPHMASRRPASPVSGMGSGGTSAAPQETVLFSRDAQTLFCSSQQGNSLKKLGRKKYEWKFPVAWRRGGKRDGL